MKNTQLITTPRKIETMRTKCSLYAIYHLVFFVLLPSRVQCLTKKHLASAYIHASTRCITRRPKSLLCLCKETGFQCEDVAKNHTFRIGRRKILHGIAGIACANSVFPWLSSSSEEDTFVSNALEDVGDERPTTASSTRNSNKPFAPNEALLPAVRVKLSIEKAIKLVEEQILTSSSTTTTELNESISKLDKLLLQPQNYIQSTLKLQGVPNQPAKQYLESYKPMNGDLPFQVYLIKNGDVGTWKDLKRKEKEQEKTNGIRAAFNAYTDVLSFSGNSYLLNVDSKTKSSMIREDKLPELKQVITSDMGMRYLYRNQILNAMDEVKAELQYQMSLLNGKDAGGSSEVDLSELLRLLKQADSACDRWFSLIEETDVKLAIMTVLSEKERLI